MAALEGESVKRSFIVLTGLTAALLAVACSRTMPASTRPTGASAWETAQDNSAFLAEQPLLASMNSRQGRLVAAIGAQLEPVVSRMYGAPIHYYLTNEQDANAYSFYAGRVFISEGMVKLAQNREEVAGILCHESAHVIHHDGRNSAVAQHRHNLYVDDLVAHHRAMFAHLLRIGDNIVQLHFSRGQELHADHTGAEICSQAGSNPWGLVWMLQYMQRMADFHTTRLSAYFADHPSNQARIKALAIFLDTNREFRAWRPKRFIRFATPL